MNLLFRSFMGTSDLRKRLTRHFEPAQLSGIVTAAREFPVTSRVDVQAALDDWFRTRTDAQLLGVHSQMSHETSTLALLCTGGPFGVEQGPLQHDEIDIGNDEPVRCLKNGLWLAQNGALPFAVFVTPSMKFGQSSGVHVEIGVPSGESGAAFSQGFFRDLEVRVAVGRTYRGRVISLESHHDYSGRGGSVRVHRLHNVSREDVILPQKTLTLLDRNVSRFVAARNEIRSLRFSTKKGLLFYGPPGTGKTHTIHYLASQLPDYTTLLVTAEQVGLLGEYFRLARFLQPAMMVVEDVDLIARYREHMRVPGEEVLLNKLLNEMDGLREDADVLFILTTNRPDQLEPALASRPGRIDQAIEFPLPDDEGRAKLVRLYSRGLDVPADLMDLIVRRSKGSSPAFIKELMRRSAQFLLEIGGGRQLTTTAVDAAIEEMVFIGGSLNLKLLGGETAEITRAVADLE
ncbi:MAG TPA: ATP-binding protein [Vicinamibacterales bacterium]|nr:ATP-binding protein [Vicinamibacterales bacterium]